MVSCKKTSKKTESRILQESRFHLGNVFRGTLSRSRNQRGGCLLVGWGNCRTGEEATQTDSSMAGA